MRKRDQNCRRSKKRKPAEKREGNAHSEKKPSSRERKRGQEIQKEKRGTALPLCWGTKSISRRELLTRPGKEKTKRGVCPIMGRDSNRVHKGRSKRDRLLQKEQETKSSCGELPAL